MNASRSALLLTATLMVASCSANDGEPGEGSGNATGTGGDGASPSSSGGGNGAATADGCRSDANLMAACEALCSAFDTAECTLMDLSIPYIYRLFVNSGETNCVAECMTGDIRMDSLPDAPTKCGPELSAYLLRIASGECINRDPAKNFFGQWDWSGAAAEIDAMTACGERCLDLPTCDSTTCNSSLSAGDVSCFWSCNGRVCEQTCN